MLYCRGRDQQVGWKYLCPLKGQKVAHTRLPSIGFRSWSRFLAVSLQVTWRRGWTEARRVWTVCLRLLPDSIAAAIWTRALLRLSPARKPLDRLPSHPYIHCVPKNDTDVGCYNFNVYHPIWDFFCRNVAQRVSYQMPPHLTNVSALPGETWTWEIATFHLNTVHCFIGKHTKQLKTHSDYHSITA